MVAPSKRVRRGGRPRSPNEIPIGPSLARLMIRHEARRALSAQVNLVAPVLRNTPNITNKVLARLLNGSTALAQSVRHAFSVQTEKQMDRIIKRFYDGQSVKLDDIMRDLAVDRETAEWLGRMTAERIADEISGPKKKKS